MSGFHRMIDMARSPEEIKKDMAPMSMPSPESSAPAYPYGLCINLTEAEIDKLGIDAADCSVGDMIHLFAIAKVTSRSDNEMETAGGGRKQCCRIELQITHLGLEDEDREDMAEASRERGRKRYGGDDDDGGLDKGSYRSK
jgi:hypothetical protein